MRVLFTAWSWPSHLYPMVPLAAALRSAGHDVLVAGQPVLLPRVAEAGLPVVRAGADLDAIPYVRDYLLTGDGGFAPGAAGRPRALEMLGALTRAMAGELAEVAREWRADLLVHELTTLAGPLAAAAAGVPSTRFRYGVDVLQRGWDLLPDAVADTADRLGVNPAEVWRGAALDPCPAGLQTPVRGETLPIRYVPYPGRQARRTLPPAAGDRVCVTWGTTMARLGPELFLAPAVLAALAPLNAEIVAVVTERQRPLLGDVPAGVRVLTGAALEPLLSGVGLLVHHGGAGTMLTGLLHGVPQLTVPRLPDHALHSRRLADSGAGLTLPPNRATPDELRRAAAEVLGNGRFAAAAGALGADMRGRPGPEDVAAGLGRIAASFPS